MSGRPVPSGDGTDVDKRTISNLGDAESTMGSDVDVAEYALWLTMDMLTMVLRKNKGRGGYDEHMASNDAKKVLACVEDDPSPQTRRVLRIDTRKNILVRESWMGVNQTAQVVI